MKLVIDRQKVESVPLAVISTEPVAALSFLYLTPGEFRQRFEHLVTPIEPVPAPAPR